MADPAVDFVISTLQSRDDRVVRAVAFRTLLRSFNDSTPDELIDPPAFPYEPGSRDTRYPPYIRDYLEHHPDPGSFLAFQAAAPAIALQSLLRAWLDFFDHPPQIDARRGPGGIDTRWGSEFWGNRVRDHSINELLRISISFDPAFDSRRWRTNGLEIVSRLLHAQRERLIPFARSDLEISEFGSLIRAPLWPRDYPSGISFHLFRDVFLLERYHSRSRLYAWLEGLARGEPRFDEAEEGVRDLGEFLDYLSSQRFEFDRSSGGEIARSRAPRSAPPAAPPPPASPAPSDGSEVKNAANPAKGSAGVGTTCARAS